MIHTFKSSLNVFPGDRYKYRFIYFRTVELSIINHENILYKLLIYASSNVNVIFPANYILS